MTMREELIKRLMKAHDLLTEAVEVPGGWLTRSRNEVWGGVADECIRQMEWARMEVAKAWDQNEGSGTIGGARSILYPPPEWKYDEGIPLTIAPDDWKPE